MRDTTSILLLVTTLATALAPGSAASQDTLRTPPPSVADTLSRRAFDIPALPLGQAIDLYRRQSGLEVTLDSALVPAARSNPISGTYSAAEALRLMLAGTGVMAVALDDRRVLLRRDTARVAQRLAPVRVVAPRDRGYVAPQTINATKTPTSLLDLPQSVSIITRDLMNDLSMQSMADVARFIPGVTMGQGEGNRDQPTIRGNNTTADFFVDGVRDDVQYFRDLYNVERVEALKGANAMLFGRGGGGGILNRVTKEAGWSRTRELALQGGSFDNRRAAIDVGQGLTSAAAGRVNGMFERSGLFRRGVTIERYGINPTITIAPGSRRTRAVLGYELFADRRTADRGIPSFDGRPVSTDIRTFFGDPDASWAKVRAHVAMATVTHEASAGVALRNRTQLGAYDKSYQNVFPGAVNATGDRVSISAYNNATQRQNLFNQTDLTIEARTGRVGHTLLVGAEIGRQATDNLRRTGYFDGTATSVTAPLSDPTISVPVTFRAAATDADNRVINTVGSVYVQDQIALSDHVQLIAGVRYERFDLRYHNNRTDSTLRRTDGMVSPRAGLLLKPARVLSLYASRSVSFLPSAGDQFSSLTNVTQGLEPERFINSEAGAKWDVAEHFSVTTALYRLDRTNTRAPSPVDPTKTVQTGSQRTTGFELGVNGSVTSAWQIAGAYANQRATITSTTTAAPAGATVPLVPRSTVSLWNRYQVARRVGVGVGVVHRADMYTAIDNRVTLPGYTEVDAALYLGLGRNVRAQANVENLFDIQYYATAHSNNNITPGSRRALRVSLTTGF